MFDIVATGGTFDILHKGHYMLLLKAFEVGRQIIIGVSSDNYATRNHKKIVNNYDIRREKLKKFIDKHFKKSNYTVYQLDDFYGPTVLTRDVQAIIATVSSLENCVKINSLRETKGMTPLEIILVPLVEDIEGKVISSTRIRDGEIDVNGNKLTFY
jgi:pantetheine-phosphate adenylyltransferase